MPTCPSTTSSWTFPERQRRGWNRRIDETPLGDAMRADAGRTRYVADSCDRRGRLSRLRGPWCSRSWRPGRQPTADPDGRHSRPTGHPAGPGARAAPVTPQQRAELQRILERTPPSWRPRPPCVKAVAKLIGPTVVHIKAEGATPGSLPYGRGRHNEEAGSGVIIQWKGKYLRADQSARGPRAPRRRESTSTWPTAGGCIPGRCWDDADTDVAVLAVEGPDLVGRPAGQQRPHGDRRFRAGRGQSLRPEPFGHLRHHQRQGPPRPAAAATPRSASRTSSRPTRPSIPATAAARCATSAARSSASTRPSPATPAAARGSASPSPSTCS